MTAMDTPPLVDPVQAEVEHLRARVAELEAELAVAYLDNGDLKFQRDAARETVGAHQDEIQALKLELDGMRRSRITTVMADGGLL